MVLGATDHGPQSAAGPAPPRPPGPAGGAHLNPVARAADVLVSGVCLAQGSYLASSLLFDAIDLLTYGGEPWLGVPSLALGSTALVALVVGGLVPALGVSWLLAIGRGAVRWLRVYAGLVALASLAMAVALALAPAAEEAGSVLDSLTPVALLCAGVSGARIALGWAGAEPLAGRWPRGLAVCSLLLVGALGWPVLSDAAAEYQPQDLRPFTVELVAAYPVQPGVTMLGATRTVTYLGTTYQLVDSDSIRMTNDDVRRVRRVADGILLRLTGEAAQSMFDRSRARMSQFDAIFVNGRLLMIPLYSGLLRGQMLIAPGEDSGGTDDLYHQLTGE